MSSFKKEFASGLVYTSLAKYSSILIQLLITAILARMLKPSDFGVVALATVFIHFFNTLTEAGLGPAIIQKKVLSGKDYDTLFFLTAAMGVGFGLLFVLASPYIGQYYQSAVLKDVCLWLSLLILFSSLDIVPNNLLLKQKKFNVIAYRTVVVHIICGCASIYAAYIGWGVYALLLSAILSKVLIFCVNYYKNPLKFAFDFTCLNGIKSYSFYQFLFNLVRYLSRNLDKMIVGKMMGMNLLGYYEKSYRLMMLPLQNITFVVTPVLQPLFSELQSDLRDLGRKYLKLLQCLAYISFPITALVFFNARELIFIAFGSQWEPAVEPFRILALTIEIQVLQSSAGAIFQSANYTKGLFFCGVLSLIIFVFGLFVACFQFGSISAVAVSFVVSTYLGDVIVFNVLFRRLGVKMIDFFSILEKPFILMVVLFVTMGLFCYFVSIDSILMSLIVKSLIMSVLTLWMLHGWKVVSVNAMMDMLKRRRGK